MCLRPLRCSLLLHKRWQMRENTSTHSRPLLLLLAHLRVHSLCVSDITLYFCPGSYDLLHKARAGSVPPNLNGLSPNGRYVNKLKTPTIFTFFFSIYLVYMSIVCFLHLGIVFSLWPSNKYFLHSYHPIQALQDKIFLFNSAIDYICILNHIFSPFIHTFSSILIEPSVCFSSSQTIMNPNISVN